MRMRTLVTTAALTGILVAVAHDLPKGAAGPAGTVGVTSVSSGTVASNLALGQQMAASYGWTGGQWACLDQLWQGESGWSQYADRARV